MRFRTTLLATGGTTTGIELPPELLAELGAGKRPPVRVTIGKHTYRTTVASMGGRFMLSMSAENRARAGIAAGDELDVEIELDTEPRTVDVAPALAAALDGKPALRAAFDALSPSRRKWHVLQVEGAKTEETLQRRIEKSLELLRTGRG